MSKNRLLRSLIGIDHPIIQAPMAGSTTPALVAAVSNAGGLGSLGATNLSPDAIIAAINEIRSLTDRPFNVNLFAGGEEDRDIDPARALAILGRYHAELGLPAPEVPSGMPNPFPAQLEAVLDANVPVFSFTFGLPNADAFTRLKERGTITIGTATTVAEARLLADAGCDAVVAQGAEAGGHRGSFASPIEDAMIGTMALVPQVVDAVDVPVIASGGIMDGRGIVAAMALGASAVQMGTAFLACEEASVPDAYRAALRKTPGERTAITRAFSGRQARGIVNEFIDAWRGHEDAILPFPLQNAATRPLRSAAAGTNDPRFLSMWAGQGAALTREPLPAAELVEALVREMRETSDRLADLEHC
jgi:nitronate monooxygenase